MHPSIERERRLLDEKRTEWIARQQEMITKEVEGLQETEYRVNHWQQAVEKISPMKIQNMWMLFQERYMMELLLFEVKEWEQLFWIKLAMIEWRRKKDRQGSGETIAGRDSIPRCTQF